MWRNIITIIVCSSVTLALFATLGMGSGAGATEEPDAPATMRIGVYDNRAIAIAYAGSAYSIVSEKMKEFEAAKAAGDDARVKELEAWGEKHQRQLHRQGFARVPVTDLLERVKDKLPALAEQLNLDAIAFECNYLGENVEKVDITLDLVSLYNPSEKSLKWAKEAMNVDPIDLDEIEKGHDH